ncbi:probable disease resistance protein At4g27220 [Cynara cardunculus var. scolymus]|uniref:probable disease resistance protein At4g27220 n=1 Tax=Cynara cardunculus var. scolymus TaxID=59895 RepID=UPI000D623A20|nr:probable disease resistance protein At4g27220 [Cynara cardunculus var. scolymus]
MKVSTSTPSSHHNDFKSREPTFMDALKALEPDNKTHMIALCGMGGVGKTIMMQNLKKVVSEKKLFDFIIEAAIGEKMEVLLIQQAIADFLSLDLKETTTAARAIKLRKSFEAHSDDGKKKFLILLDDVWEFFDLNDIGLSPLPNQGIDFKVLLTSRDRGVCTTIGVQLDSILNVKVIENSEAYNFFLQFVRVSNDDDLDLELREIGEDIANRCHGLPIAIKTIARTLKGKSKHVWEDTRSRIENKDVDEAVHQVFEISYRNFHDKETRSTLLLCCLFPEDFDTPVEDLVRYGWGLKIFNKVNTIRKARNRLYACIERLIHANLLIQSEEVGCVKMHDLVRAFVLDMCSEGEHASVVGDMSNWPAKPVSEFCKRISITCTGMSKFPRDRKYPNLLLLKLMNGEKSFPKDFYQEMEKLEVIAYERMFYPLIPKSLQYSSNLRMLSIHECSFMFDCSPVGDLLNLELLSFTDCKIEKLPSTIGNLKKLKLLNLTGCSNLCIDDGVLKSLVKLEELYMEGVRRHANGDELVECSKNLDAIEIEFFGDNALPKNMSFGKLERFKISLGCSLKYHPRQNKHSFENTLWLVTKKCELLDSRVNDLFGKTKVLHLQVDGINDLGDCFGESLHHFGCPFFSLRVLHIRGCAHLRYLFTIHVANGLKQLEHLKIIECPALETLIDNENCEVEVIKFPALKFLSLINLPMLMSLCKLGGNVIEFPQLEVLELDNLPNFTSIYQDFLKKEVMSSKLKVLTIMKMEKLKEIWPSQYLSSNEVSQLRMIQVKKCDSLVNLFPSNPMSLLYHLEQLTVSECGSIDVLFNIDLGSCVDEIEQGNNNLRSITAIGLRKLREVWTVKGVVNSSLPILGFQSVECIVIRRCKRLRNVFTPTTSNFDMRAVKEITIDGIDGWGENKSNDEEINVTTNQEISEVDDDIHNVAFPSYLMHNLHQLHTLKLHYFEGVEVVFKIESSSCRKLATTQNNQQPELLPHLKDLELIGLKRMTHVWKYDWNQFLVSQQEPKPSSFVNITSITLRSCDCIKYLFSPLMAKLLSNLISIGIESCRAMEEVVSNIDDEDEEMATSISCHTNTTFFPRLDILDLRVLSCLKRINGGGNNCGGKELMTSTVTSSSAQCYQVGGAYWSSFQYAKTIDIRACNALLTLFPSHDVGHMPKLEKLVITSCTSMREIFEIEGVNEDIGDNANIGEGSGDTVTIPTPINMTSLELPNLKTLYIAGCHSLKYIFTASVLESLKKLQELKISDCSAIQVIVKQEDNGEHIIGLEDVVFPRLTTLTLVGLPSLKGFFLGKNDFQWPLLDKVEIYGCPQMMIFTSGRSMASKLEYIHTGVGKHSLECGLNFDWTNAPHEGQLCKSSTCSTGADIIKLLQFPWSFSNLVEVHVRPFDVASRASSKAIFPSNELFNVENVGDIEEAEKVFEMM